MAGTYEIEQWKAVVRFEGWYEVSNQGRVRNVKERSRTEVGRVLKSYLGFSRGRPTYLRVGLVKLRKKSRHSVHRLVAQTWVPNTAGPDAEVHHKDEIKTHNWAENLEWLTRVKHEKLSIHPKGEKNGRARLCQDQVDDIRMRYKRYSHRVSNSLDLSKEFGITRAQVNSIIFGRSWKIRTTTTEAA